MYNVKTSYIYRVAYFDLEEGFVNVGGRSSLSGGSEL